MTLAQIISVVKHNESLGFESRVEVGFPVLLIEYFAHLNACVLELFQKKVTYIHDRGIYSRRLAFQDPGGNSENNYVCWQVSKS